MNFDTFLLFMPPLLGGLGAAVVGGPVGTLLIWQRLGYLSDTLTHASFLGVGLSLVWGGGLEPWALISSLVLGMACTISLQRTSWSQESILLFLSQGALTFGLCMMAFLQIPAVDLMASISGDFLTITWRDCFWIWGCATLGIILLGVYWRPFLLSIVHKETAILEGGPVTVLHGGFLILTCCVVALSLRLMGVLLLTSLLIFPPLSMRPWGRSPRHLCVLSGLCGGVGVCMGLSLSLLLDMPTGPMISLALIAVLSVSYGLSWVMQRAPV